MTGVKNVVAGIGVEDIRIADARAAHCRATADRVSSRALTCKASCVVSRGNGQHVADRCVFREPIPDAIAFSIRPSGREDRDKVPRVREWLVIAGCRIEVSSTGDARMMDGQIVDIRKRDRSRRVDVERAASVAPFSIGGR